MREEQSGLLNRNRPAAALLLAPVLLALVLAGSTLGWPFLWDDFDFLGRAATFSPRDLLPSGDIIFYRPVSREIYFWLLYHAGGASPIVAHVMSAAIIAGILLLVMSIARRLAGCRTAVISALVLAACAAAPLALGWISAVQDLFCCLFAFAAIRLQLSQKTIAAAAMMFVALLSKETALAFAPIPVAIVYLSGRDRSAMLRAGIAQGAVVILWAVIHPSIRGMVLGSTSGRAGGSEYVAFQGAGAAQSIAEGVALSMNLPWLASMSIPSHLVPWAIGGTALLVGAIVLLDRVCPKGTDAHEPSEGMARVSNAKLLAIIGLMAWLGSILVTSLVVHRWFTYYALLPATGLSLIAGLFLRRTKPIVVLGVLSLFLWAGIGFRGARLDPELPSELNFREAGIALTQVEHGFKKLRPMLPPDANVFVSVQTRGHGGLYRHLFRTQPLRVWYHEPRLWVLDPNRRRGEGREDFLFWIAPELDVWEINPITLQPRGPKQVISLAQYQKALRGYAFGLAGMGGVDRAVQILTTMPEPSAQVAVFDRRAAAALYFAAGREGDAGEILARTAKFDREQSIGAAAALLNEPITGLDLDVPAMRAFGLNPNDLDALRTLMQYLETLHAPGAASRIALRVIAQAPGDAEASRVMRETSRLPQPKEIVRPVPYDIPQESR